jgi:hypothetical protein
MKPKKKKKKKLSLKEAYPSLAKEWHPEKNDIFTPDDVSPTDFVHAWWRCDLKHEWIATVKDRVNGAGCPYCPGKESDSADNLAAVAPHIIPFWHPSKNKGVTPADIWPGSTKKVWWKCEKGHEFERTVRSMKESQNCPVCRKLDREKACKLQDHNPELAREWHPVKNGDLTPDKVSAFASKKVWWLCPEGHEYRASVLERTRNIPGRKPRGCPYCAGRKDLRKESLAILRPDLAKEWHPEKNRGLTPEKVSTVNMRWVWWKCKNGHQWLAPIYGRVYGKKWATCPQCGELSSKSRPGRPGRKKKGKKKQAK